MNDLKCLYVKLVENGRGVLFEAYFYKRERDRQTPSRQESIPELTYEELASIFRNCLSREDFRRIFDETVRQGQLYQNEDGTLGIDLLQVYGLKSEYHFWQEIREAALRLNQARQLNF